MLDREEDDSGRTDVTSLDDSNWRVACPSDAQEPDILAPGLPMRDCALFFDFDGTLADLAPQPDKVMVRSHLPAMLGRVGSSLGGALAIVSGRPVDEIDRHLHPLKLCVAGVHGAERRFRDGFLRRIPVNGLDPAARQIESLCAHFPALRMERKPGAIALHYRHAPELEALCVDAMLKALKYTQGMALLRGKMVVEIKPSRATKATAVRDFMDNSPFRHRRPWFFGDDVTDESAFDFVQSIGGVAVKIGKGETLAAYRLRDPAALHSWLERALALLTAGNRADTLS